MEEAPGLGYEIEQALKTVYDPEIPVNIVDLGLVYRIHTRRFVGENGNYAEAFVVMTLTAPNCPVADQVVEDVRKATISVNGIRKATVELTFNPRWDKSMMSLEARFELGYL